MAQTTAIAALRAMNAYGVEAFLEREVSVFLENVIVMKMGFLNKRDKSEGVLLAALEKEWPAWSKQTPEERGDPNLPGKVGEENTEALQRIAVAIRAISKPPVLL